MNGEEVWKYNLGTYERIFSLVEGIAEVSILSMVLLLAKDERISVELFREDSEKIEIAFLYAKKMIEERGICKSFLEEGEIIAKEIFKKVYDEDLSFYKA